MSFGFINTNKITLESFTADVVPVDFINDISKLADGTEADSYINTDNGRVKYVDPVPYISSLKSVQEKLEQLMSECDKRKSVFENSTSNRETDHFNNVINQSSSAADLKSKFSELLTTVERLNSSKIDPLSEKLKKASCLKDNSSNIIFLMKCYNQFYKNGEPPFELLRDKKNNDTTDTAKTISLLVKLSSELSNDGALTKGKETHTLISEFATSFESDQLKSFNTYYQSKNFARLQNITKTLFAYNNGKNIVDFFVESHPIFVQMQGEVNHSVDAEYWKNINNPMNFQYELDESSLKLLEAARDTIVGEIDSITTIFQENAKMALSSLIGKLFDTIIRPRVQLLMKLANSEGKLCYLRILHLLSNNVSQHTILPLRSALLDKQIDLAIEFDKITISLFNDYLRDGMYFKIEKENSDTMIEALISPFEAANKDSFRDKKLTLAIEKARELEEADDVFSPSEKITLDEGNSAYAPTSSVGTNSDTSFSPPSQAGSRKNLEVYLPDTRILRDKVKSARNYVPSSQKLKKVTGITSFIKLNEKYSLFDRYKSTYSNTEPTNGFRKSLSNIAVVTPQTKSQLSLDVTQSIYKIILEALTRSIDLAPSQINAYTVELFKLMLYKVGPSYIALGLESLYDNYIDSQSKNRGVFSRGSNNEIDLSFLSQFYSIFLQLYLLSTVVKNSFYPLISNDDDMNLVSDSFNSFLQNVEIGVNVILKESIDIVKSRIDAILSKQPPNDYSLSNDSDRTQTSEVMAMFLESVLRSALSELKFDSKLKIKFVSRISNYFLSALILHLSHLKVTMDGFTTLTHDLAQYILIFNNLKMEELGGNSLVKEDTSNTEAKESLRWEKEQLDQIQHAFKILNELPGLYTCEPNSLKDFCSEGKLVDLKKDVIKDYIKNREDYQNWFLQNL